ncbi:MAG: DASH family cryptochrome [Flavobacteriia bacterium]|nr:DASH family cryptochrome [Flavobacteriia bacterium]
MRVLHWFRNDLRLTDNPALLAATREATELIGLYVFDERWFEEGIHNGPRISGYRAQFIWECLEDLKVGLASIGGQLIILKGNTVGLIASSFTEYECDFLSFTKHVGHEEIGDEKAIVSLLGSDKVMSRWGHTLVDIDNLPFTIEKLPNIFTPFRGKIEKYHTYPTTVESVQKQFSPISGMDSPGLSSFSELRIQPSSIDERAVLQFKGGEKAANERLRHYTWDSQALSTYKETRNGLVGADYSSKFSPWLATGSISPRTILEEVKKYEDEVGANDSTYWLIFELLWRDFFQLVALKHSHELFAEFGWKGYARDWKHNFGLFKKWIDGTTGDPFVDANMKELKRTGFMSNRGRQNVASFLVHQYKIDWRWGASYFEEMLIDYDVASNWGNWSYVSGTGNDPRKDRVFNTKLQAERYDPDGEYQRIWLD